MSIFLYAVGLAFAAIGILLTYSAISLPMSESYLQSISFLLGVGALIISAILVSGGAIVEAISRKS